MASLKTDGKLKATITVGSGGGIGKKQLEEALSTKADINHTHDEYLTEHQTLEHLALKDHTHEEYLTEHQDISHLASTQYVNDSLKEKSDELILYANGVASMEARNAVGELRNELVNYATTTVLKYNGVEATDLNQEEFAIFIGDLRTELDELKSSMTSMVSAAEPISEYYVAYTIDKSVSTFSLRNNVEVTVGSGGYIPECSEGYEFVKITLLDGNLTTDLNTRISKVDSIKVYYPEKTTSIKFTDTKVKEVEYINLENVTDMTNMFQNCTSLESVELINTNNIVVDETTFEGVSEECAITVGKKWDKTEEESGFAGTFINPWKYYIEYTIQDDNNTYLDPSHIPTITSIENDYDESNYTQNFNSIDVYLKDGSIITDSLDGILVSDVERIIAYYSEETVSIKCPPFIKSVENINIEKLTQMHYMFTGCSYLTEIKELENWDVTNINTMEAMFANCISLTSLNLSNWNIDNVGNTIMMFSSCSSLQLLNLSTWNTNSIDICENMFEYISSDIDWCYDEADPNSYANWTLTEEQTGYSGTFPWNVYDNPYYIEYTISGSGSQTLESKPNYYIPQISVNGSKYTQEYDKIEITLNDDSITSDLNTLATDVKLIRAYYNENVIGMKVGTMTSDRFKSVNYIKTDNFTSLRFGSGQLTSLDLSNLNLNSLTSMNSMFYDCTKLEEIKGLDRLDTSKITSMGNMFYDCKSLTSLDISNFDTSNVTNMSWMFFNCNLLKSLDLSNWDISSVVTNINSLSNMFYGCTSLISLNLSTWKTGNIIGVGGMLKNVPENVDWCYDKSDPNSYANFTLTEEQTGFSGTFPWNKQEEEKLTVAKYTFNTGANVLPKFNPEFTSEYSIEDIDNGDNTTTRIISITPSDILPTTINFSGKNDLLSVEYLDTSNVTNMSFIFSSCPSLTSLDLSNFNTSNVTNMCAMFHNCTSLTSLDLSNFDIINVTNMESMFSDCTSLTSLDLSNFDTINVNSMHCMFDRCSSLTSLNLSSFNTSNVTDMGAMFRDCTSLTSLDLSNFNTSNVTNMGAMFRDCTSLTSLDLSNFDTINVTNMESMFNNISSDIDWCYDENDPNSYANFTLTERQTGFNGTFPWPKKLDNPYYVEYTVVRNDEIMSESSGYYTDELLDQSRLITVTLLDGTTVGNLNVSASEVAKIRIDYDETSQFTFRGCYNIERILYVNMCDSEPSYMFSECTSLLYVDLSSISYVAPSNLSGMFGGCISLQTVDLSGWSTKSVDNTGNMFNNCNSLQTVDLSGWSTSSLRNLDNMFISVPRTCQILYSSDDFQLDIHDAYFEGELKNVGPASLVFKGYSKSGVQESTIKIAYDHDENKFVNSFRSIDKQMDGGILIINSSIGELLVIDNGQYSFRDFADIGVLNNQLLFTESFSDGDLIDIGLSEGSSSMKFVYIDGYEKTESELIVMPCTVMISSDGLILQ